VNPTQPIPPLDSSKSHRVFLQLRDAIANGEFAAGTLIPGELHLAERFLVSRVTIRRALAALAQQGLIARRRGIGTIVIDQTLSTTHITADASSLMPGISRMGRDSQVRLLAFGYRPASRVVSQHLGLAANATVQHAVRLRSVDGKAFSHLTTHVPERFARHYGAEQLANTPLHTLLERSGVRLHSATQTISATLAGPATAEALETVAGAALIAVHRAVFDDSGQGVEYLQALYRPDRYRLQIHLNRNGQADDRYWEPAPVARHASD
jgi:GntR family transcriptional regulator